QHVALAAPAAWLAYEPCQRVTRLFGRSCRTGLVRAAGAIHFASGDPREPDARPFGAPDRTIAIPDAGRSAREGLSGRNDGGGRQKQKAHRPLLLAADAVAIPIEMPAVAGLPATDRGSPRCSCFRAVAPCPIGGRSGS